jgi:hypothetical protein
MKPRAENGDLLAIAVQLPIRDEMKEFIRAGAAIRSM